MVSKPFFVSSCSKACKDSNNNGTLIRSLKDKCVKFPEAIKPNVIAVLKACDADPCDMEKVKAVSKTRLNCTTSASTAYLIAYLDW